MRPMRIASGALAVGGLALLGKHILTRRPALPDGPDDYVIPALDPPGPDDLRVTFLGVSTLVITDGETTLVTDGFFTRPGFARMMCTKVRPDEAIIDACLQRVGLASADAVLVAHSHYDHAMDSPVVADRTGAVLVGSASTLQIGRGYGLPERQLLAVEAGEPIRFGRFSVTMLLSEHAPNAHYPGLISRPIEPPARIMDYRMAECYSMLITHDRPVGQPFRILVHASAGFVPGVLRGMRADTAYLGIGTLGKQPPAFLSDYWDETVVATGARAVVPIHWDDFTKPLSEPLVPFPYIADNLDVSWRFLRDKCDGAGISLRMPRAWVPTDPQP